MRGTWKLLCAVLSILAVAGCASRPGETSSPQVCVPGRPEVARRQARDTLDRMVRGMHEESGEEAPDYEVVSEEVANTDTATVVEERPDGTEVQITRNVTCFNYSVFFPAPEPETAVMRGPQDEWYLP